jgi:hypothetical protein
MLQKTQILSSKIRITANPEKTESFSKRHITFYRNYSSFVFKALRRPSYQKFLHWMLRSERIEARRVGAVDVEVFPFRRKNGRGLAGNCNTTRGKIRIYPKTMKFCREFTQKFGKGTLLMYVGSRARAALIHELLHLKYAEDEKRVRALAREYFFDFTRNRLSNTLTPVSIYRMVFGVKPIETAQSYEKNSFVPESLRV